MNAKQFRKKIPNSAMRFFQNRYNGTFSEFADDWKWIFSFSKRYKWIIVFYTLLGFLSSTLTLASAYLSRILINIITQREISKLGILIAATVGSALFSLLFSSVMSRVNARISIYVNNDIQGEIFDKIMDAQWKELSQYQNGDLLNRFNSDVSTISSNAIGWIPNVILSVYSFVLTCVVLLRLDPIMALIALTSAPFLLLMSRFIMRKNKEYRKKVLDLNSQMMSFEVDTFSNYDSIKSFGAIPHYCRELRNWQKRWKDYSLSYNMFRIRTNIAVTLLSTMVSFLSLGYCLFRLWTGQILFGDMTFFLQQRSALSSNFSALVGTIPGMLNSAISAHRVRELVSLKKEIHDPSSQEKMQILKDQALSIRLRGASFGYSDGNPVYSDTDFLARSNEIIAILGESGGGKTTLFRLLLGLVHPESGTVELLDESGGALEMNADLRPLVSYVPQGNSAILGSIADNLRIVKEDATDEEIIRALQIAHAWEFVAPIGINAKLGDRGRGLSEGQSQRIAIARAMLRDAPILMLDEATSALDEETENLVLDSILQARPNRTVIVATHRPSVLSRCNRVYRIENGSLILVSGAQGEDRIG